MIKVATGLRAVKGHQLLAIVSLSPLWTSDKFWLIGLVMPQTTGGSIPPGPLDPLIDLG